MGAKVVYKDKDSKKIITADFTKWLGSSNIASVSWTADPGITLSNASNTTKKATNYVSSGVYDGEYFVKVAITTDDTVPRIEARSFEIKVLRAF